MALSKIGSDGLVNDAVGPTQLDETANYAFTGTVTGAGGVNTPAFFARNTANQTVNDNVDTKVTLGTEVFDTDNCFDNTTNYRFTPNVAGKYCIYSKVTCDEAAGNVRNAQNKIYKNGSNISTSFVNFHSNDPDNKDGEGASPTQSLVLEMNGTTDYVELYSAIDTHNGGTAYVQGNATVFVTFFGAYKIIE